MKNVIYFLFLCPLFFACISCGNIDGSEIEVVENHEIDVITVYDTETETSVEYQYDQTDARFIGEVPSQTGVSKRAKVINGDLISEEPNASGGKNIKCLDSPNVCYTYSYD